MSEEVSIEELSFEMVVAQLVDWAGETVHVTVASRDGGRIQARLTGTLKRGPQADSWASLDGPDGQAVGFQVGPEPENYFVLYRRAFRSGYWVSREYGFLMTETATIDLGVELVDRADEDPPDRA